MGVFFSFVEFNCKCMFCGDVGFLHWFICLWQMGALLAIWTLLTSLYFCLSLRQGALGGKEQKVGPGVRQEKEPRKFVLSSDNVDSHILMQVIQARLESHFFNFIVDEIKLYGLPLLDTFGCCVISNSIHVVTMTSGEIKRRKMDEFCILNLLLIQLLDVSPAYYLLMIL